MNTTNLFQAGASLVIVAIMAVFVVMWDRKYLAEKKDHKLPKEVDEKLDYFEKRIS